MNKADSYIHIKAILEVDWRIDKAEPDFEKGAFKITPYHGLCKEPFVISVWGDNELAAMWDLVRGLERGGIFDA